MKQINKSLLWIFLIATYMAIAQNNKVHYQINLNSSIANQNETPFWIRVNSYGKNTQANFSYVETGIFGNIFSRTHKFTINYGSDFTTYLIPSKKPIINELYATLNFKKWGITIGSKNDDLQFGGLSSSNGNIVKSINARAIPGVDFKSNGYIKLPFAKNWLGVKLSYGEYFMNDKRYVNNAHLHHKSLYFKSTINSKLNIITGLDHYVQWGGTSDELGKMPNSFSDYLRIITGSSGSSNALAGEQINALGNTVGHYLLQINHVSRTLNWSFYYSHPFEDRSGREMKNFPDALYGLYFKLNHKNSIFNEFIIEFTNTKQMSGSFALSGRDNYFNNSIYRSGWTYFGNVLGSPYFVTKPIEDGITKGVDLDFSRFNSFHFAFSGSLLHNITYKTHLSYTKYFGWFSSPVKNNLFSGSLETTFKTKLPFDIKTILAADLSKTLPKTIGFYLSIIKKGIF
ncbi:MAG: capsule assembly Wzi family protein [Lutibacter sp.]